MRETLGSPRTAASLSDPVAHIRRAMSQVITTAEPPASDPPPPAPPRTPRPDRASSYRSSPRPPPAAAARSPAPRPARRAPGYPARPPPDRHATPRSRSSSQRRCARASGLAVTNNFRSRIGKNHRADVAAVQHRAARPRRSRAGTPATPPARRAPRRRRRRRRRPPARAGRSASRSVGRSARAARLGGHRIGRTLAAIQHAAPDRAIQQAGVEVGQPMMRGEAARQRALAGRRRSVDRDDPARHGGQASAIVAPSCPISAAKPRKTGVDEAGVVHPHRLLA